MDLFAQTFNRCGMPHGMIVQVHEYSTHTYHGNNVISHDNNRTTTFYDPSNSLFPLNSISYPQAVLPNNHLMSPFPVYRPRTRHTSPSSQSMSTFSDRSLPALPFLANPHSTAAACPPPGNGAVLGDLQHFLRHTVPLSIVAPASFIKGALTPMFEEYVSFEQLQAGLRLGVYQQGQMVIKSAEHAYIHTPGKIKEDIFISGEKHRNRALDGDIVVVKILHSKGSRKMGKVVYMSAMLGQRLVTGNITNQGRKSKVVVDEEKVQLTLRPVDTARFPMIKIPMAAVPVDMRSSILEQRGKRAVHYVAQITEWPVYQRNPMAKIVRCINPEQILVNADTLTTSPEETNKVKVDSTETTTDLRPPNEETDLQKKVMGDFPLDCVLTVDRPETATGASLALSCKRLGDGLYSVAVLVSTAGEEADGEARFTIFTLTDEGEMVDAESTPGIIRSCTTLSSRQLQDMIKGVESQSLLDMADSSSGQFEQDLVRQAVKDLHHIAQVRRRQRSMDGQLELEQGQWASRQLIEELTVLTNMVRP